MTITERHIKTNEMIPHNCFETELPDTFVSKHSYWINTEHQIVEFRPIQFKETDFLDNKPYVLSLAKGYVTTNDAANKQILVNQSSIFFETLFSRYFIRLDSRPHVYMMRDYFSE